MTKAKTANCGAEDGKRRASAASVYLEMAELASADGTPAGLNVAAGNAVLAAIAASDALCCIRLGRRSRAQAHADAVELLKTVLPGGPDLAKDLARVLSVKDEAHYGTTFLSKPALTATMRAAGRLVTAAEHAAVGW